MATIQLSLTRTWFVSAVALFMLAALGCDDTSHHPPAPTSKGSSSAAQAPPPAANTIELVFPYGSEKKLWLTDVTDAFNQQQNKTSSGKIIQVKAIPMGSGETMQEVLEGRLKADLVSPASAAFIRLSNAESQTKTGKDLVGDTQDLVLSPVIIAMWQPMAEALGWPDQPVGWADLLEIARNDEGWAAYGYPQWGRFKFGHTHPQYSNSGLISLFAEVYAATGKQTGLTLDDVADPGTGEFLRSIERSIVHYGSSTGFFGRKLFNNGPTYLSAAVLYENLVIESYDQSKYPNMPFPIVAIYPKEGTFWSDHPVGIVQRDWVTPEREEAAEAYIAYLLDRPQQAKAIGYGFRPSDPAIAIGAPIDTAHGVDPAEPKTTLEVPSVGVMDSITKLWHKNKKHANIVLVIDTSGSMRGRKIVSAKQGARELIDMLGEEDRLSVVAFSSQVNWLVKDSPISSGRSQAIAAIDSLIADGGTALYNATHESYQHLLAQSSPDRIDAVVVLTDGKDSAKGMALSDLTSKIVYDSETQTVRIFPIGYGDSADHHILKQIAEQSQAKNYHGTPETIREVFKEISTFF